MPHIERHDSDVAHEAWQTTFLYAGWDFAGETVKTPSRTSYTSGEIVTLNAVPDTGYESDSWTGDLTGGSSPATLMMDSDKVVTANFQPVLADANPPVVTYCQPEPNAIPIPLNSLVLLHISDDGGGVDANTIAISVDDTVVYAGNAPSYRSALGACRRGRTTGGGIAMSMRGLGGWNRVV